MHIGVADCKPEIVNAFGKFNVFFAKIGFPFAHCLCPRTAASPYKRRIDSRKRTSAASAVSTNSVNARIFQKYAILGKHKFGFGGGESVFFQNLQSGEFCYEQVCPAAVDVVRRLARKFYNDIPKLSVFALHRCTKLRLLACGGRTRNSVRDRI